MNAVLGTCVLHALEPFALTDTLLLTLDEPVKADERQFDFTEPRLDLGWSLVGRTESV